MEILLSFPDKIDKLWYNIKFKIIQTLATTINVLIGWNLNSTNKFIIIAH